MTHSLVPHGPYKRPVFRGATDPDYQRMAAWVKSLRRSTDSGSTAAARFPALEPVPSPVAADAPGFAIDRVRPASPPAAPLLPSAPPDGRPEPPATPNPVTPLPPGQYVAGSGSGMQSYAPPDADFTVPYMMGGPRPPKPGATAGQAPGQPALPAAPGVELPPLPAATPAAAAAPPAAVPPAAATANDAGAAAGAVPKTARKPVKIDPALLERALMNRYTTPQ